MTQFHRVMDGKSSKLKSAYEKMLTESDILAALRDCFDPEVKLNLVDLGLIYSIETGPDPDSTPAWPRSVGQSHHDSDHAVLPRFRSDLRAGTQPARHHPRYQQSGSKSRVGTQVDAASHQRRGSKATGHLGWACALNYTCAEGGRRERILRKDSLFAVMFSTASPTCSSMDCARLT